MLVDVVVSSGLVNTACLLLWLPGWVGVCCDFDTGTGAPEDGVVGCTEVALEGPSEVTGVEVHVEICFASSSPTFCSSSCSTFGVAESIAG